MQSRNIECPVTLINRVIGECNFLLESISSLMLPVLRPRIFEQTDAGPGVGISNKQVIYRAAESVRIHQLDYYARIHRASGDCQNPVERTQASVGKAIANGDRIHWEHKPMFHGLTEDEKSSMSLEDYGKYDEDRLKYDVLKTC